MLGAHGALITDVRIKWHVDLFSRHYCLVPEAKLFMVVYYTYQDNNLSVFLSLVLFSQ